MGGPPQAGAPFAGAPAPSNHHPAGAAPQRQPKPARQAAPAPSAASMSMDLGDLGADSGMQTGKTFSAPVIAAMVVCFIIGTAIMWAFMSSVNANALVAMQEEDAKTLADAVKPKVQTFQEVAEKISKLSLSAPDGEKAKELADAEFAVPGAMLATVRVPLAGGITDSVAGYAADSAMIASLLDEHDRMTNKVDKEELEEILKGNETVQNNRAFAVIYDYQDVVKNAESDKYQPKRGTLVGVRDFKEESKKYEIEFLSSGRLGEIEPQKLIPIDTAQILKAGGQNALSRYQQRVRNIKFHAARVANYAPSLVDSLDRASSGEMPATPDEKAAAQAAAVEAPVEEAPAEEAEAEEKPAEENAAEEEAPSK